MASVSRPQGTLVTIDGQGINIASQRDLIGQVVAAARARRGFTLFTINLDHLVKRRTDAAFRDAYRRATFVTADGAPIVALARRERVRLQRTTGADLLLPLCAAAARDRLPVYFFGSTETSLAAAAAQLSLRFPRLEIRGFEAPPQGFDPLSAAAEKAGARIARSDASLCFIGLGAPKQELFADRMAATYPHVGYLCVGAALDFLSGTQARAPRLLQRAGFEWAWRLIANPRRLSLRYARCLALLADLMLLQPLQRRAGAIAANTNFDQ